MEINPSNFEKILSIVYAGVLAMVGQLATLIHNRLWGQIINVRSWFMSLVLAFVIGWVVKDFIPVNNSYKDAMLIISWVIAQPIYSLLSKLGKKYLKKYYGDEE